jgi:hypothetical protein
MRNDFGAFRSRSVITKIVVIFVFSTAVSLAVFHLWQNGKLIEKTNATDSYAEIVQPYVGSQVIAHSDAEEGSMYEWTVNDESVQSGTVPTTFLAHFDGNTQTASGENPVSQGSVAYESAKYGQGMVGTADYSMSGNIDVTQGTLDLWFTLKKPLNDPDFDSSPYFFYYHNSSTGDTYMVNVHSTDVLTFTMYDHSDGWPLSVQTGTTNYTLPVNTPIHFVATWSVANKFAKLYLNGDQINRRDYSADQHFPEITVDSGNFRIGNANVIIDEARVLRDILTTDQIKDAYVRGIPSSESDIYYNGLPNENDSIELSITNGGIPLSDSAIVKRQKLTVTSPTGYFIQSTDQFDVTFTTPTAMTCRYGAKPDTYDQLPSVVTGEGTDHTISIAVDSIVEQFPVAIKCHGTSDDADDYGFYRRYRVLPAPNNEYPKISRIWWGNSVSDSDVAYLSKFDLVNTSRSSITKPGPIRQIKTLNPDEVVLIYNDLIGTQNYGGVAYASDVDRLNDDWRLQSSETPGDYCVNLYFPVTSVFNLNPEIPFDKVSVDHVELDLIDRLSYYDGIWWDNAGASFWFLYDYAGNPTQYTENCDFDLDGIDEDLNVAQDLAKAEQIWLDGIHSMMQQTHQRLGQEAIIIGNNASIHQDFNGRLYEHKFSPSTFSQHLDPNNQQGFIYWEKNSLSPHLNENLFQNSYTFGTTAHYRYMRYGLTASLLAGIHFNPNTGAANSNNTWWYDEYWIDFATARPTDDRSVGSGYLGEPLGDYYTVQTNVYRRDFENGIVLLNNQALSATINLGGTYRYLDATSGGQDAAANSGGETTSVTLGGIDGRILLNPLPPVDNTAPGTINDLVAN